MKRYLAGSLLLLISLNAAATEEDMLILSKPVSAEKQQSMTPKQALMRLKEGNQRFLSNRMQQRDFLAQAKRSSYGQYPWVVILNCMDSRSVPELVFDQGLADLFVLRVAGNVVNEDIIGSMEFATKAVGTPLIVVLGHSSCGAVAGACGDVKLGHLNHVLDKIKPAVEPAKKTTGLNDCSEHKLVDAIAKNNALNMVRQIQQQSPIIRDLIAQGKVGIVAGMHDLKTGQVTFFEEERLLPNKKN
ncbi:carbonic anhydrase family protein [Legionella jordanis]|uniref:Carbonic anhydrase Mig5 n=1 Tax=Legionella jordanis TaxID=456 RepID=A0A0W0V9Q6_9GAMM|nr:carbonic anhydrase family protein [Legionella jordanis]KTD16865.1 carbonic anhydrase Mig5 [Legionella jordanis]RMX00350.1 carbonic anhydrase [Legionella jordanis]RMX15530.1 carbonic anhydrase [Legionella jordanis]VEH13562.1 carbonic anhydrase Mig5 [Legionella jordanis]HAT8715205.1 carbonic anhydrase [Legionella jordanis]